VKQDYAKALGYYLKAEKIYHYSEDPAFKNDKKSQKWKLFAQKHAFEI